MSKFEEQGVINMPQGQKQKSYVGIRLDISTCGNLVTAFYMYYAINKITYHEKPLKLMYKVTCIVSASSISTRQHASVSTMRARTLKGVLSSLST